MSKLIKCAIATSLACLALSIPAKEARAASPALCTIFDVDFQVTPLTALTINCAGDSTFYTAFYTPGTGDGGCPIYTVDQVRTWANMASAAYIAGKTVQLFYSDPANTNGWTCITSIRLSPI